MSTQPHPRQPPGVPVGGQFATTPKTEPQLTLNSPAQMQYIAADQAAKALADALNVSPSTVKTRIDASDACGLPQGHAFVELTVPLGDDLHHDVDLDFEVSEDGEITGMDCTVGYDIAPTAGFAREDVRSGLGRNQPVNDTNIAQLITDTLDQADMQRRAETQVNRPQQDNKGYIDALRVEFVNGGRHPAVEIEPYSLKSRAPRVHLDLGQGTGIITGGWVASHYGTLQLDGDNLDQVASAVDRDITMGMGNWDQSLAADRNALESRFAAIVSPNPAHL